MRKYADDAQVMYDTLNSMNCLGEMNADNPEKMILRLPKWAQGKFAEYLKKIERSGSTMATFHNIVDFLKDRADVANHPFFSKTSESNRDEKVFGGGQRRSSERRTILTTRSNNRDDISKEQLCPKCNNLHPLYRCEVFKSESPEERGEFVKRNRICFNCINSKEHISRTCNSSIRCRSPGCGKPHHTLLHMSSPPKEKKTKSDVGTMTLSIDEFKSTNNLTSKQRNEVLLQVIPLRIINEDGNQVTTYGLIDSGSDVTMIDLSLVERLRIKGSSGRISLSTVNTKDVEETGLKVDFTIAPTDDDNDLGINVNDAWAIKDLNIPLKPYSVVRRSVNQWPHLNDLKFPEVERQKISVLIGTNIPEAFIPLEVKKGIPCEPLAIKSCLGWSVLGNCNVSNTNGSGPRLRAQLNHVVQDEVSLDKQLEHFWKTESYGLEKLESKPMTVEDQYAQRIIESTISKVDGHYQMGLLWKEQNPRLPCNRVVAEARLSHLKKRLQRDPELHNKYRAVIEDYIAKGYARKMTAEEASPRSNITWYRPHHPVFNPNKPGKMRVVFDAAAKFQDTSLNEHLLQGPDLTNDLVGVLIRFRQDRIAYAADIEAMFHQTRVISKDTDALRFLWWSNSIDDPPEEYQMLVHIFGATSSPCCASKALRQIADDNESKFDQEVIQTLRRNFYVDDNLKSVSTIPKAIWLVEQLTKLLAEGGFHFSKPVEDWSSMG